MRGNVGGELSRLASDYGMLLVLLLLGAWWSVVTYKEQRLEGSAAVDDVAGQAAARLEPGARVLVVARWNVGDVEFAEALGERLEEQGLEVVDTVTGPPREARAALEKIAASGQGLDAVACNQATARWLLLAELDRIVPPLEGTPVLEPRSYWWPDFLKTRNLLNVANQIVVIAIIAIGMTLVIITGGIDLSVGSLIALAAVVATWCVRAAAGGEDASVAGVVLACAAGVGVCGVMGLFSGLMVTLFGIPPFIVTLAIMQVASGLAFIIATGQSIYQLPEFFTWLGRGSDLLGIPNAVVLMGGLYVAAHVLMSRTVAGRWIYAVGGNREAARLSGVPVRRVLLCVYATGGVLAGLGGIVMASQLDSGSPNYGQTYELFVIAAVVVGGTSLAGGEGKIFGTLIGAFIIAVINNGMNLTGVESYTQKVVLGLVILGAVLLDMTKKGGFAALRARLGGRG